MIMNVSKFSPTPSIPDNPTRLDDWITEFENQPGNVRKRARARIVWANRDSKKSTAYSLVYLHGFKASHPEGYPTHCDLAQQLECNLYLSRLKGHGLDLEEPLADFIVDDLIESARLAMEIGNRIGEKVVLIGTSTGASLALLLASLPEFRDSIKALVLYAPLIRFHGMEHYFLCTRTGRALLRVIRGKNYLFRSDQAEHVSYDPDWYSQYKLQGALALGQFVQTYMNTSLFRDIGCPVFTGYYYKNEKEQDRVVSVEAITNDLKEGLGSERDSITFINYPEAGSHILPSDKYSGCQPRLLSDTLHFLNNVMSAK